MSYRTWSPSRRNNFRRHIIHPALTLLSFALIGTIVLCVYYS